MGPDFSTTTNDGMPDLFIANGHILDNIHLVHDNVSYAEPNLLFRNLGSGRFENVTSRLGPDIVQPGVSRGAAVGDYDNDGDLDLLISNNGQAPQLLRNEGGNTNHWLAIQLVGTTSNRDGIGARITLGAGNYKHV